MNIEKANLNKVDLNNIKPETKVEHTTTMSSEKNEQSLDKLASMNKSLVNFRGVNDNYADDSTLNLQKNLIKTINRLRGNSTQNKTEDAIISRLQQKLYEVESKLPNISTRTISKYYYNWDIEPTIKDTQKIYDEFVSGYHQQPDEFSLRPIQSEEEYKNLIKKFKQHRFMFVKDSPYNNIFTKLLQVPFEYEGILPYSIMGHDKSIFINSYLRGKLPQYFDRWLSSMYEGREMQDTRLEDFGLFEDAKDIPDYVRVLDYSLKKHAENEGYYNGWVYRKGKMEENPHGFTSTSLDPTVPFDKAKQYLTAEFQIIKVSHGHELKKGGVGWFDESEILLDRDTHYKKIPPEEYTPEIKEQIFKFIKSSNAYRRGFFNNKTVDELIEMFSNITVWEEVS